MTSKENRWDQFHVTQNCLFEGPFTGHKHHNNSSLPQMLILSTPEEFRAQGF